MTTEKDQIQDKRESDYELDTLTNDRLLKDHEYDGIRELDNQLPPWWKWLFVITIVFSIIYLIRLWVFHADDLVQRKEFDKEMASVKTQPKSTEVFEIKILDDATSIANGKETWQKICAVCHLADGGGLVGPNMTDNYWIHGNTVEDLFNVTTTGVIEKGMISYKDQLSQRQRLEVVSYILTEIQGSTPANPKAPEGELYE